MDSRNVKALNGIKYEVAEPITVAEVESAIKLSNPKGAPGSDGHKLSHMKVLGLVGLVCHFNLWLLAGGPSSRLHQGRTTLIPRKLQRISPVTIDRSPLRHSLRDSSIKLLPKDSNPVCQYHAGRKP